LIEAERKLAALHSIHSARTQWGAQLDDGIGHTFVSTPVPMSARDENTDNKGIADTIIYLSLLFDTRVSSLNEQ